MRHGVKRVAKCGLSCNLDVHILSAALPLFESGEVEAIEWSFDTLFQHDQMPDWFDQLLHIYGSEGCLIGHGVYFSLFSGRWLPEQAQWLANLKQTCQKYAFDHISEHFGYMTGTDFHKGAPLSVPLNSESLHIAQSRIKQMSNAAGLPVGLENLAFAYGEHEIKNQLSFLEKVVDPVNGFLILDLHNIYCQVKNFNLSFDYVMDLFPLHLVREIHISGGSWEESKVEQNRKIRRDTHDEAVPSEVFDYLQKILPKLANLKFVILESLGSGLESVSSQVRFRQDFDTMKAICQNSFLPDTMEIDFLPNPTMKLEEISESPQLAKEQSTLSDILEQSASIEEVQNRLQQSCLANSDWKIEHWDKTMVETAYQIAQKWKKGF